MIQISHKIDKKITVVLTIHLATIIIILSQITNPQINIIVTTWDMDTASPTSKKNQSMHQ